MTVLVSLWHMTLLVAGGAHNTTDEQMAHDITVQQIEHGIACEQMTNDGTGKHVAHNIAGEQLT